MRSCRGLAPEQVFLAVGVVAGVLIALLTPPLKGADEPAHLYRAYQISEGAILAERGDEGVGGFLPRSLRDRWRRISTGPGAQRTLMGAWARAMPLTPSDRVFIDFRNTAVYSPVAYLPQAMAIGVGRALGLPSILLLYLGRFAGLAGAIGLVFLAIRVTPIAKRLFVLLALTPMALRQMSLLGADTVTNAAAFLLIALFLRLALDPAARLQGRFLVLLSVCSLVVSLSKQAYFPLLFLYFLCPIDRVGVRKRYLAAFLGMAGLNAVALLGWFWAIRSLYVSQRIAPDAHPFLQLGFIVSDPIRYLLILLTDLHQHGWSYMAQCFGYVGRPPQAFGWLQGAALLLVAFVDGEKQMAVGFRGKLLIVAVLLSTIGLINTLSYLGWNPVGAGSISFIQGRYYIPITPLPFLLLSNRRFSSAFRNDRFTLAVACLAAFVASLAIRFLVLRWYGA